MTTLGRFDRRENFSVNVLGRQQCFGSDVETFHGDPVRLLRQKVVDLGGLFQMRQIGFLQVPCLRSVVAGAFESYHSLRLRRWNAQVDNQVLDRQAINFVLGLAKPGHELSAAFGRHTRGLVREVRGDIAVGENGLARGQRRF